MPTTSPSSTPTHREVRIVGRPEAGPVDPETGARSAGGVEYLDRGETIRLEDGDVRNVPVKVAEGLIRDGLAVDPADVVETDDDVETFTLPPAGADL